MRPVHRLTPLVLLAASLAAADPGRSTSGTPQNREHGIDLAGRDRSVVPGEDFFGFANGNWDKNSPIPPDKAHWSTGGELAEQATHRVRELIEDATKAPAGTEQRKVGDFYASYMDEKAIEARGLAPVKPALQQIAAIKDKTALARVLGDGLRTDVDPLNNTNFYTDRLLGAWVAPDLNAPTQYAPYLLQGGLGLPDREYYLNDSPRM